MVTIICPHCGKGIELEVVKTKPAVVKKAAAKKPVAKKKAAKKKSVKKV